jgi:hypothetical protein
LRLSACCPSNLPVIHPPACHSLLPTASLTTLPRSPAPPPPPPPPPPPRFELTHKQIGAALASPHLDITQPRDVPLPPWMVPPERLQQLLASMQPRYVGLDGNPAGDAFPPPTPEFGVVQRRLSNGIRVNYRCVWAGGWVGGGGVGWGGGAWSVCICVTPLPGVVGKGAQ